MLQSTIWQKILRVGFWGLLFYITITSSVVIAIQFQLISVPKKAQSKEETAKTEPHLLQLSEISFSKLFAREYLSWTIGEEKSRSTRLQPFLGPGIDEQGGLDFSKSEWNSYPQNIEVWKIENRENGVKEVTVYAETYLTKVNNEDLQKRIDRYMVVPIRKAGDSYLVVDTPNFIAPPVASSLPKEKETEEKGEPVNVALRTEIEQWLPTFWKTYTNDSPHEISYLMKNNQPTVGLAGVMNFIESKKVEVRKEGNDYLVKNQVLLQDIATKTEVTYNYTLKLVKEENRWFILDIKQGEG